MLCPHKNCDAKSVVLQTRERGSGFIVRRYICTEGHRFTTAEGVVPEGAAGRVTQSAIRQTVEALSVDQ